MKAPYVPARPYRVLSALLALLFAIPQGLLVPAWAQAPSVRIAINGGGSNRSSVTGLTFLPTNSVLPTPGGLRVRRLPEGTAVPASNILSEVVGASNLIRLSFTNNPGPSLPDGNYVASLVTAPATNPVGPRASHSVQFHRLFGDRDGDRDVDFSDSYWMRNTWLQARGSNRFDPSFDHDGDGRVGNLDLQRFNSNYFTILSGTPALVAHLIWDDGADLGDGITTRPDVAGRILGAPAGANLMGIVDRAGGTPRPASLDLSSEVTASGEFELSAARLAHLAGGALSKDVSYVLRLALTSPLGQALAVDEVPFRLASECPLQESEWQFSVSAVGAGSRPGSARIEDCRIVLEEGDSFRVSAERSIAVPQGAVVLSFTVQMAGLDLRATNRIRDAFEAALVDESGRPVTFTIQGERGIVPMAVQRPIGLPPIPDAFVNQVEGLGWTAAPGALVQDLGLGLHRVYVQVAHLAGSSRARLILRLANNDGDRGTFVRISEVGYGQTAPPGIGNGIGVPALSSLAGSATGSTAGILESAFAGKPPFSGAIPGVTSSFPAGIVGGASNPKCPTLAGPITNSNNGHVYYLLPQSTWTEAEEMAQCLGGHLATIRNAAENLFVFTNFSRFGGVDRGLWIGLTDVGQEGNFRWISGEPFGFQLWARGEPNNYDAGIPSQRSESYVHLWDPTFATVPFGRWNDLPDTATLVTPFTRLFGVAEVAAGSSTRQLTLTVESPPTGTSLPTGPAMLTGNSAVTSLGSDPAWLRTATQWRSQDGGNDHRYLVVATNRLISWSEARVAAMAMGGYLATITSEAENAFAFSLVDRPEFWMSPGINSIGPWIGGYQPPGSPEPAGGWRWIHGEGPLVFKRWDGGEPNNNPGGVPEDVTVFWATGQNRRSPAWNDVTDSPITRSFLVEFEQAPVANGEIVRVSINGQSVDALDAAGNFFAKVEIKPGPNRFVVVASDELLQSVTNVVSVFGLPSAQQFSSLGEVSASVIPRYGRTSIRDGGAFLYAELALQNSGSFPVRAPFYVGVRNISDPSVTVVSPDGVSGDGVPYYDFTAALTGGGLVPGQRSAFRTVAFHNPNRVPFTFEYVVLGQLNRAPEITSVPPTDAAIGRAFTYPVEARDPDDDPLTFALAQRPSGMTIEPATGLLRWTPTVSDRGTHEVEVVVTDTQHASARQRFHVSVTSGGPNRPPIFTSRPVTIARSASSEPAVSVPIDLRRWLPAVQLFSDSQGPAQWTVTSNGTVAIQELNADASILLSDEMLTQDRVEGSFSVQTTNDDDLIGFVFGYRDAGHFYLFDWKQTSQTDTLGVAQQGMSIKVVHLDSPIQKADIRPTISPDPTRVRTLYTNGIPYEDFREYRFALEHRPGEIRIEVFDGARLVTSIRLNDSTYAPGRFGFYNESQEAVRYSGFSRAALKDPTYVYRTTAQDPDGDTLTFSLRSGPVGMQMDSRTGVIQWRPSYAQLGSHPVVLEVADGRGGVGVQEFVVCVLGPQGNRPPVVVSDPPRRVLLDTHCRPGVLDSGLRYELEALDLDGDVVSWRLVSAPDRAEFGREDRRLRWDPRLEDLGLHTFVLEASDGRGGLTVHEFVVEVEASRALGLAGWIAEDGNRDGSVGGGRLVYSQGFESVAGGLGEWSDRRLGTTPVGSRRFLGEFGNDVTELRLTGLGAHSNLLVECDLFVIRTWDGMIPVWGGERWGLSVSPGTNEFVTSFQSIFCDGGTGRPGDQPYPGTFGGAMYPALFGGMEVNSLGYEWTDVDANPPLRFPIDTVYRIRRVLRHTASNVAVRFRGEGLQELTDESWGVDNVQVRLDVSEPSVSGATVFLDENENGRLDWGESSWVTLESGQFQFPALPLGRHLVGIIPPWHSDTRSAAFLQDIVLSPGTPVTDLNVAIPRPRAGQQNQSPTIRAVGIAEAVVGEPFRLRMQLSDPDGDPVSLRVAAAPEGLAWATNHGMLLWVPAKEQVGEHLVLLQAQDGNGGVAATTVSVRVRLRNEAPVFVTAPSTTLQVGQDWSYRVQALDPEEDAVVVSMTGSIPGGLRMEATPGLPGSSTMRWSPTVQDIGRHRLELVAVDPRGERAVQTVILEVLPTTANVAPEVVTTPRSRIRHGLAYAQPLQARDANGDTLRFNLIDGPPGMVVLDSRTSLTDSRLASLPAALRPGSQSGLVLWQGSNTLVGTHPVIIEVADGRPGGEVLVTFDLAVVLGLSNSAPSIVSTPMTRATLGQVYAHAAEAFDAEGDLLTWTLGEGPQGMVMDPVSGQVRWLPGEDQVGVHRVSVTVSDDLFGTSTQSFEVEVGCANGRPQIVSVPSVTASVGRTYVYAPRAVDPEGDALTWTLMASVPAGMTVDSATGFVRWTPTTAQVGTHVVRLEVSDRRGGNHVQTYSIVVSDVAANRPPVLVGTAPRGVPAGSVYTFAFEATDPDGDTLLGQLLPGPASARIEVQSSEAGRLRAQLVWAPGPADLGEWQFVLAVRDAKGGSAAQRFTVAVRTNRPPQILSEPGTAVLAGATYQYDVRAVDPDGDPLIYRLESAPPGARITELGQLTWTTDKASVGSVTPVVVVSDSFGAEVRQRFTVAVSADTRPPVVGLEVGYNLVGEDGTRYVQAGSRVSLRVSATDDVGVASRQLQIGAQLLPLNADGGATMEFPVAGVFEAVAEARDASGNVGTAREQIIVIDPGGPNGGGGGIGSSVGIAIHSPTNSALVGRLADIVATVTSTRPLTRYAIEYAELTSEVAALEIPVGDPRLVFRPLTNGLFPANTTNTGRRVLGRFDPTLLQNGGYLIRVSAYDVTGQGRQEGAVVEVSGNLKFGEFRMEFVDLQVPVAGIPITVRRVYDSRDSGRVGDFGHGWSLALADPRILETGKRQGAGLDESTMSVRTRVYLTGPDGRRNGYSLVPRFRIGGMFTTVYDMTFRSDPGVYDTLEADDPGGLTVMRDGSIGLALFGGLIGFDPAAYRLKTRDGLVYHYEQPGGLRRVTDLTGNSLTFEADGIRHSSGQRISFHRDELGRISRIVDPNGGVLRYDYDAAGDLRRFSDPVTNVTRYAYDPARPHFLNQIIDPLGREALNLVYGDDGRLSLVLDASGNPIQQEFDLDRNVGTLTDARGNQTLIHFDDRGNESARIIPGISTNRFAYDQDNNLTNSINARGFATNFTYDARGNVTSITDPLTNVTRIAYNDLNKPVRVDNALGQTLHLRYDGAGGLVEVINNTGSRTLVTRDAQGRVASLTDAAGQTTRFDYTDGCACGKPGKVINPDGSFRISEYDSLGNVTRAVNEVGAEILSAYDATGKLLWTRDPLTNYTRYYYNGPLLTNVVDALGRSTRYGYDSLNRTNRIIDAEGGVVVLEYDENGNRTRVVDPVGNATRFLYDAANRLIQQVDPLGKTNFFAYDPEGNRIEARDRNGRRRTFRYDGANRMTNELWWEGTNVVRSIAFGFNELGVQTLAVDPAARYEYRYDALNRLERVLSQSAGVPDFTLLYTYTALGQVESVTDHWGARVSSVYDNRNRLATRTWSSTQPAAGVDPARVDFGYDASGNRLRTDRFADLAGTNRIGSTTNRYNQAGIVTNITHLGPARQVLAKYDYEFDPAYQIRKWTINNQPSEFGYDRTGQLTNTLNTTLPDETFRFDPNGNRVGSQSGGNYAVGGNNQILFDGTSRYTYDAEGNMASRSNTTTGVLTTYQWDHRNRLLAVLDRNAAGVVTQTVSFVYDAMNRRLAKTVATPQGTNVVRFLYNQDDSWADLDATNSVIARYLHGARIDELLARQRKTDGRGWYLTDHLGTVRDIANAAGAAVAHVDYSSFGEVLAVSNSGAVDRFGFTGRELDGETGLWFYRARYLDLRLGRFLNEDSMGFASREVNLTRYGHNQPSRFTDPFGEAIFDYAAIQRNIAGFSRAAIQCLGDAAFTSVAEGGVYLIVTGFLGTPGGFGLSNVYVGQAQNFTVRFLQHEASGLGGRGARIISEIPIALSKEILENPEKLRTVEQLLMNSFGGKAQLLNKINASKKLFCL